MSTSTLPHRRRASGLLALALGAAALAGCGGGGESSASGDSGSSTATPSQSPSSSPSESPSESPSASASAGSTATGSSVTIGKTVTDSDLGDSIVFEKVVRQFPIPASASAIKDRGDELVLVQVKVTVGKKYYSNIDDSSFTWGVGTADYSGQGAMTPDVQAAMKAAGYAPLVQVRTGKTGEGWVAGFLRKPGDPAGYIGYRRVALSGSDGTQFPAKEWKVTLPVS